MPTLGPSKMFCMVFTFCVAAAILAPAQTLTTLVNFNGSNGQNPQAPLIQGSDGNFYGTTVQGGANGAGAVIKVTPSGVVTVLHSFNGNDGLNPYAGLTSGNDGSFYGTTSAGGAHQIGEVFKITPSGSFAVLHFFNYTYNEGGYPGPVTLGNDGYLYGLTTHGGEPDNGTFYKVSRDGNSFATLYYFDSSVGKQALGALIKDSAGNFYGASGLGGSSGNGTVFKLTPSGTATVVYNFCMQSGCPDGSNPNSVMLSSDGNFYGAAGSSNGAGEIFKLTLGGTLTVLHTFNRTDGYTPNPGLIQAHDGNFYGTTISGGPQYYGTIFQVTGAGTLTSLYNFDGTTHGGNPKAGMVQGSDNKFYGTTSIGGTSNFGTLFKLAVPTVTTIDGADRQSQSVVPEPGGDHDRHGDRARWFDADRDGGVQRRWLRHWLGHAERLRRRRIELFGPQPRQSQYERRLSGLGNFLGQHFDHRGAGSEAQQHDRGDQHAQSFHRGRHRHHHGHRRTCRATAADRHGELHLQWRRNFRLRCGDAESIAHRNLHQRRRWQSGPTRW